MEDFFRVASVLFGSGILWVLLGAIMKGVKSDFYTKKEMDQMMKDLIEHSEHKYAFAMVCEERHKRGAV